MRIMAALIAPASLHASATVAAEPIFLHAAGSLRASLTEVAAAYEAAGGAKVQTKFGPSGVLREAIDGGEKAQVFASANMAHPQALSAAGKSGPVVLFARNRMCALLWWSAWRRRATMEPGR